METPFARWFAPHVVLFIAFLLRIANLTGESLWRDEVDTVRFAFEPLGVILANFTATGFNGPMYHLLVRAWLSFAGVSDFALRYLSLVCGVALVALVHVLGKRMFGARVALIAMWLAAIAPILIWYAGEGKMYSLQPMLLALALYALLRAIDHFRLPIADYRLPEASHQSKIQNRKSKIWWMVFIVAASLSFYVQLLSPLFLPVAALFFIALWPHSRRHVAGGLFALALLTLPYVPLAIWQVPAFLQGGNIGHAFYPLDQMTLTLASNWAFGLDGRAPLLNAPVPDQWVSLLRWVIVLAIAAVIVYGFVETARRTRECTVERARFRLQLSTLGWLALPAVSIFVISTRLPIFQPRYLLWCAPALYLLIAVGLVRLFEPGRAGGAAQTVVLAVISLVSLSGVASQVVNPIRPDLRGAVAFVTGAMQPTDAIVFQIPYARHSFAYYAWQFGRPLDRVHVVEAPYTNHGMSENEVGVAMLSSLPPVNRVWLFETEAPMWDARGLVRAWMDAELRLVEQRDLRGVRVRLYEVAPGLSE